MIVGEVEPIGGVVGSSVSEPLLQARILPSVLGYIVHIDRWMAAAAFALFVPQLVFVPLLQGAINRRAGARVWILGHLGVSAVDTRSASAERDASEGKRIDRCKKAIEALRPMEDGRYRHLPIVDDGKVVGLFRASTSVGSNWIASTRRPAFGNGSEQNNPPLQ